jgi:hypothetical protein
MLRTNNPAFRCSHVPEFRQSFVPAFRGSVGTWEWVFPRKILVLRGGKAGAIVRQANWI